MVSYRPQWKKNYLKRFNGYQQYSYTFFENGYCLIENFLLNEKGEKAQRFPSNIYSISPFIDNVALFQDSKPDYGDSLTYKEKVSESLNIREL